MLNEFVKEIIMIPYFLKKIGMAVFQMHRFFHKPVSPKLVMTLLVKNEEFMLEQNLLFHKSMGVDYFIVTDNNSTDSTMEILRKYQQKGWILEIIEETAENYDQKKWVDRMIWKAKQTYHADWVINADADELWHSPSGNIKNELKTAKGNVLECKVNSVYPEEGKPFWKWNYKVEYVLNHEMYNLSQYSIFERQNKKVIHRTDGYLQISMGNHKVGMCPLWKQQCDIQVYHYTVRGRKAFIEKMINGGQQLEQRKKKHGGRHWRYFYQLYKENKLEEEYKRVIGEEFFKQLKADGFIIPDSTISDYFSSVLKYD